MSEQLINAIADMREDEALKLVKEMVEGDSNPVTILDDARKAMDIVGKRYEEGTYFLPELMLAGEMLNQITDILKPELAKLPEVERHGKVIIGTVAGDIHDIGKNMVAMMLECAGYRVIDLGVDVSRDKFLAAAKKYQAQIVAISALLSTTLAEMEAVVADVRAKSGSSLKTLVGGAPVTASFAAEIGADGYSPDAAGAVSMARSLITA